MRPRLAFLLRLNALAGIVVLLLGHSVTGDADAPSCDGFSAARLAFRVAGTCGPAGVIELGASADSCDIWQEGDEVGLPSVGTRNRVPDGDLALGGFKLYNPQKPQGYSCSASKSEFGLSMFCRDSDDKTCTAELKPEG